MKQTLTLLTIGLVFTFALKAQKPEFSLKADLLSGCPKEIEWVKNQLNWGIYSYSSLETGIDTLRVFFGESTYEGKRGYWIASVGKNNFSNFSPTELMINKNSEFPSDTINIRFDNSKIISIQLRHNIKKNEIEYNWLNKKQKSNVAIIENIEKPIVRGKKLPFIKAQSLNGYSILIKDFLGKYVVINWWHTGCAPCRQEIPGLNKLVEKYKGNQNVVFVAIAYDTKERVENYLKYKEFKYKQSLGNKEIAAIFGETFPVHLIINPQGVTTFNIIGGSEDTYKDIDEELKRQMNEK